MEFIALFLVIGALFVGAVFLVAQVVTNASRIRMLEQRLAGLRNLLESLERTVEALKSGEPAASARPVTPSAAIPRAVRAEELPPGTVPAAPTPQPAPPPAATPPPRKPSRSREEWEALIGGKLLNRIGALALILAVGFFLKYAFDKDWITEIARVGIGALAGVLCLLLAERTTRRGFQVFAQGLVGAGIAILYVTVYASFNFYALVSQPVAFVLMLGVTALAFVQAFRHNALAVSILGLVGGFLTPFLLQTEETNVPGLFAYLLVLDLGLLAAVVQRDRWAVLEPLAFAGTYATYLAWHATQYSDVHLWTCVVFLSLVWFLFHLTDLIRVRRTVTGYAELRRALAVFYLVVYFITLNNVLRPESDGTRALLMLALGLLYAASAVAVRSALPPLRTALPHYLASATVLALIATTVYFEGFAEVIACSLEAAMFVWIGLRITQKAVWGTAMWSLGVVFLLLLGADGALSYEPLEEFRLLVNDRFLAFALLGAALALSGIWYRQTRSSRWVSELLHYGWLVVLVLAISVETNDLFRAWSAGRPELVMEHLAFERTLTLAGLWVLLSLPLLGFGLGAVIRPVFYMAAWMLLIAGALAVLRALLYEPIEEYRLLLNMRTAVLLITASVGYGAYSALAKPDTPFSYTPAFRSLFRFIPVLAVLVLVSTETWDVFRWQALALPPAGSSAELTRLENLQQLSLSSVWLLFSIALMALGFWRRDRSFRLQAIALFGVAILKIFLYDLSFLETLYRIFSFVGLGVILLAVSYLYQRYKEVILSPTGEEEAPPLA